jgi:hypothetical protein
MESDIPLKRSRNNLFVNLNADKRRLGDINRLVSTILLSEQPPTWINIEVTSN